MHNFTIFDLFEDLDCKNVNQSKIREIIQEPYYSIKTIIGRINETKFSKYERDQKVTSILINGIVYNDQITSKERINQIFAYYSTNQKAGFKKNEVIHRLVLQMRGQYWEYVFSKVEQDVRRHYESAWMYFTESMLLFPDTYNSNYKLKMEAYYFSELYSWIGLENHCIESKAVIRRMGKEFGGYSFNFGLQSEIKYENSILIVSNNELKYKINKQNFECLVKAIDVWDYTRLFIDGRITKITFDINDDESLKMIIGKIVFENSHNVIEEDIKVAIQQIDSETLYSYAFGIANMGGAYESGLYNAMSKKAAWEFILGILRYRPGFVSKDDIMASLDKSLLIEFSTNTGIFINEWFDFGLFLLNRETLDFSILVISDTD